MANSKTVSTAVKNISGTQCDVYLIVVGSVNKFNSNRTLRELS